MKERKIRLIIADDHSIVRDGLRGLFKSDPRFTVAGEAADGEQVVALAEELVPDVIVMDISMPGLTGIEATRRIKATLPATKILILTIHESEEFVYEMIHAGANGYVLKNAEKSEIVSAVVAVAAGEPFFSPPVSKLLIEGFIRRTHEPEAERGAEHTTLTPRELEVLRHIAEGSTSREIADKLHISHTTVNTHRTNLMKKLDIHDTAGLVRYAITHNIVRVTPA